GIPCFIKAVQMLRRRDPVCNERIVFTLGLFCGHMKSARFLESQALQMGVKPHSLKGFDFRKKLPDRPANWYRSEAVDRSGHVMQQDWWNMVDGDWGAGYFMNSACNFCDDVVAETADISLGDAWVEPYSSDGWGTNVVIVRSNDAHELIERGIAEG